MDDQMGHETLETVDKGKHGKEYELRMSTLLFKRIIDQNFEDFSLTREKKGLGKFDDLAYIYKRKGEIAKYSLVQFKHLEDKSQKISYNDLKNNEQFLLQKYYSHNFESNETRAADKDFQNCDLESLIICTNVELDNNLVNITKYEITNNTNNRLFRITGNDERKLWGLKINDKAKKDIFPDSYRPDYVKMADELVRRVFLSKQIDLEQMKDVGDISMIKKYHVVLEKYVIDSKNQSLRKEFLNPIATSSYEIKELKKCFIKSADKLCSDNKILTIDQLQKKFDIKQKTISRKLQTKICMYNSKQTETDKIDFLLGQKVNVKISSSFGNGSKYPNDKMDLPKIEKVNEADVNSEIDKFLSKFIFAVNQKNNDAILKREMNEKVFIEFNEKMKIWYDKGWHEDHTTKTKMRNWITKRKMIEQALSYKINFQGEEISLKKMLPENIESQFLDPSLLMLTFCSMEVSIGHKPDELLAYHIDRKLFRNTALTEKVFINNNKDSFVLLVQEFSSDFDFAKSLLPKGESLLSLHDADVKCRFLYTKNRAEFDAFVKNNPVFGDYKNIHLIRCISKCNFCGKRHVLIEKMHGSSNHIKHSIINNVDCAHYLIKEDEYISDHGNAKTFSVFSAEPGMGKSTLVKSIAKRFIDENKTRKYPDFVIKVELKYYWKEITEKLKEGKLENVPDFLSCLDGFKEHSFLSDVVRHFWEKGERIILFFDGFDEINAEARKNILKLLENLRNEAKVRHVCVTSRPHFTEELENALDVFSYSIKEISKKEQIKFLVTFSNPKTEKMKEVIRKNSEKLITKFNQEIGSQEKLFLGIPLQLHMFALAYEKELPKEHPKIPESLSVAALFEAFFLRKCEICIDQKLDIKITDQNKSAKYIFLEYFDKWHQYFALRFGGLFSEELEEDIKLFFKEDEQMKECSRNEENARKINVLQFGILFETNDVMYFTHRAFAEFLVAKRFVTFALKKDNSKYKSAMLRILLHRDQRFLSYLFDQQLLEKQNLSAHKAVMTGNDETIQSLTASELRVRDSLGRTPFYFAVRYHSCVITIDTLNDKGSIFDLDDEFFIKQIGTILELSYKFHKNFFKYDLQALNRNFLSIFEHEKNVEMENEIPGWERLHNLLKILCSHSDFTYIFDVNDHQESLRILHAYLSRISPENGDKNVAFNLFVFNFQCCCLQLEESEARDLLKELESRLQLFRPDHCYALDFHFICSLSIDLALIKNCSSSKHFFEILENTLRKLFLFNSFLFENIDLLNNFSVDSLFWPFRFQSFPVSPYDIMDLVGHSYGSQDSLFSFGSNFDHEIPLQEQREVNTITKYEAELGLTDKSDGEMRRLFGNDENFLGTLKVRSRKLKHRCFKIQKKLIETSDFRNLQRFMEDFKYLIEESTINIIIGIDEDDIIESIRDCFNEAERKGWLKAAVRLADDRLRDWKKCFNDQRRSVKYWGYPDEWEHEPPSAICEIISEYKAKI